MLSLGASARMLGHSKPGMLVPPNAPSPHCRRVMSRKHTKSLSTFLPVGTTCIGHRVVMVALVLAWGGGTVCMVALVLASPLDGAGVRYCGAAEAHWMAQIPLRSSGSQYLIACASHSLSHVLCKATSAAMDDTVRALRLAPVRDISTLRTCAAVQKYTVFKQGV